MSLTYEFTRDDEGTIFRLCMADIYQELDARAFEHSREREKVTDEQLKKIIQGVEAGMSNIWADIVQSAVSEVLDYD